MSAKPITFDDLAKVAKELADNAKHRQDDFFHSIIKGCMVPEPFIRPPERPSFTKFWFDTGIKIDHRFAMSRMAISTTPTPRLYLYGNHKDANKAMNFIRDQGISYKWHSRPEHPEWLGWVSTEPGENKYIRVINLNRDKADVFTVLHEAGHILCGLCCCTGHEEWAVYDFVVKMHAHLELETPIPDNLRTYRDTFLLERMLCERGVKLSSPEN